VVVPSPVDTIFDFLAAYRSENLPLKYEQLVLLSFGQHPRLTVVEQAWADQGLVNGEFYLASKVGRLQMFAQSEEAPIFSLDSHCISRLTSFVGVIRDPWYTNSLTTSKCLSPITTHCPTS
jgi:hypothetical protein